MHKAYRTALIHDLSEADFADTWAQTVTYGLLTAATQRDYGNRTWGDDPLIHFYEHLLAAYDKALKVKRGIFY